MERGVIIKDVLLKLGENGVYNDNSSEIYKTVNTLLDHVLNEIPYISAFDYLATKVTLTKDRQGNFNIPIDCSNILRADKEYEIENEFLICDSDQITIEYTRRLPIEEIPNHFFELLSLAVAKRMCLAYPTYLEKLQYFSIEFENMKNRLISQQNFKYKGEI